MQEEIWKDITWYEWLYQVSNFGKILSTKRKNTKWWILRPWSNPQGYEIASIYLNWVQKYYTVHRLVALAFIPQEEWKDQVNHKDGNKKNNRVDNLEWCTMSENLKHSFRVLGRKVCKTWTWKFWSLHHNAKAIEQYSLEWEFIREFWWMAEATREVWVDRASIYSCCMGKYKQAWWFIWKYKKQPE